MRAAFHLFTVSSVPMCACRPQESPSAHHPGTPPAAAAPDRGQHAAGNGLEGEDLVVEPGSGAQGPCACRRQC